MPVSENVPRHETMQRIKAGDEYQPTSGIEAMPEYEVTQRSEVTPEREEAQGPAPVPRREETQGPAPVPRREEVPRPAPVPRREEVPRPAPAPRREEVPRVEPISGREQEIRVIPVAERGAASKSEPGSVLRPILTAPVRERQNATAKWQQLSNIYPHIRPFEDERDYLKIKPEDFVILTKKYYPLVTNSFLKHGYYNYKHLILAREMRKDGEHYYIGVPGNIYEKEKQVAVLFGFESFEGKEEPAKNGDFGYYMISVEI